MNNRRQFLGALSRALLLPVAGSGAVAFADPAKAASIPMMTAAPLPFSADCLQLRSIKRALAALPENSDIGSPGQKGRWYRMQNEEYHPVKMRVSTRPVTSWTDCVELAEIIWTEWEKECHECRGSVSIDIEGRECREHGFCERQPTAKLAVHANRVGPGSFYARHAITALVEGVLALGGGERFDPKVRP